MSARATMFVTFMIMVGGMAGTGVTWLGQVVVVGHGRWSWPHSTERLVPDRERQTGGGGVELMR